MRLSAVAGTAAHAASRALLVAAIPLQGVISPNRTTHGFINQQARRILAADGHEDLALRLQPLADAMDAGSIWADAGWKSMTHMYNPQTGQGLWDGPSAPEVCERYHRQAVRAWRLGAVRRAAFLLGAAAHIVQDLCVPHHACNRLLQGHSTFEALAEAECHRHGAHAGGLYDQADSAAGWVHRNAEAAQPYMVLASGDPDQMREAISDLLPLAHRTTAGFLAFFFDETGVVNWSTSSASPTGSRRNWRTC